MRPRRHVGAHPFSRVAGGGYPVCLVQLGHQLDFDPDQGQRFRNHLGGKGGQDRQCRPRPDRPADRGRRSRRALDQRVGDLVGLAPGKLRLQRGPVPYPQPRGHGHHLRCQPACPPAHAAPGGPHPAPGRSHPAPGCPRGRLQRGRQAALLPRRLRRLGDFGDQARRLLRDGVCRRSRRSARLTVRIGHDHHLPRLIVHHRAAPPARRHHGPAAGHSLGHRGPRRTGRRAGSSRSRHGPL